MIGRSFESKALSEHLREENEAQSVMGQAEDKDAADARDVSGQSLTEALGVNTNPTVDNEANDMQEKLEIKLTRQQIYDEIWAISVAGVARKYGVPYTSLMRQVKTANIPTPPSGYWTMLDFGKEAVKPELRGEVDEVVSIDATALKTRKKKTITSSSIKTTRPKPIKKIVKQPGTHIQPEAKKAETIQTLEEPETVTQYGQTLNVYKRETLYREVWAMPVTEVAKRYKVSDVAIHKVCKSLDIPTPPLGYWAKKRAGKPVVVPPLPQSNKPSEKTGIQTGMTRESGTDKEMLAFMSEEERAILLSVASQILLPDEGAKMIPQIVAHRKVIAEWKKRQKENEQRGWRGRSDEPAPYLAGCTSESALPRVCRVIDALVKALEPLGCSLTDDLGFTVNDETIWLGFSESQDKVSHVLTKEENLQLLKYEEERKRYSYASKPQIRKYDYVYNGKISVAVGGQKSFRDCKSYMIEDCLDDMMLLLYEEAESLKKAREAREEAARKRQEEERRKEERRERYNKEVDQTLSLTNLADDYEIACRIRQYIAVVETSESLSEEKARWIEWAKAKADWYDPTVAKSDEFFGRRKHEQDEERKALRHKGYGW